VSVRNTRRARATTANYAVSDSLDIALHDARPMLKTATLSQEMLA
jgi:hypothetical protein